MRAAFPVGAGDPSCSTSSSDGSRTGTEYAIACRSFNSVREGNPNRSRTAAASTSHGTFVSFATCSTIGPATPKVAAEMKPAAG